MRTLKVLNYVALILLLIGGITWGLYGWFGYNLITSVIHNGVAVRIFYIIIGVAALYKIVFIACCSAFCEKRK